MPGFIILLFLTTGLSNLHARHIYISADGADEINCGDTMAYACKDLDYVYDQYFMYIIFGKIDKVILNGGEVAPMKYYLEKTILLFSNIAITGDPKSRFRPIIARSFHQRTKPITSAFASTSTSALISLRSINFENIDVLICKYRPCRISLFNCTVRGRRYDKPSEGFLKVLTILQNTRNPSIVDIQHCSFHNSIIALRHYVLISISNSSIKGGKILYFSDRNHHFNLNIKNVVFVSNFVLQVTVNARPNISISNATFINVYNDSSIVYVQCLFSPNRCKGDPTLEPAIVIQNTKFINCKSLHSIIRISGQWARFTDLNIVNNSFSTVFYTRNSKVTLLNVKFVNNTLFGRSSMIKTLSSRLAASHLEITNNKASTSRYSNVSIFFYVESIIIDMFKSNVTASVLEITDNVVKKICKIDQASSFLFYDSIITHNNLTYVGNSYDSDMIMKNIKVTHNKYLQYGWVYETRSNSKIDIENIIMEDNTGVISHFSFNSHAAKRITLSLTNVTIVSSGQTANLPVVQISALTGVIRINNLSLHLKGDSFKALETLFPTDDVTLEEFDVKISCAVGFNPSIEKAFQQSTSFGMHANCYQCAANSYTLTGGDIHVSGVTNKTINIHKANIFKCNLCENGGECSKGRTRSRGYFYGFKQTKDTIKYLPCPAGYCCSNKTECLSYNTCATLRRGTLCGQCQHGYQEYLFSESKCIRNDSCKNEIPFWILFKLSVIVCTTAIIYLDVFPVLFKKYFRLIRAVLKTLTSTEPSHRNHTMELGSTNNSTENEGSVGNSSEQTNTQDAKERHYTISGILNTLISYYQIKSLLTVAKVYQREDNFEFLKLTSDIFNMDLIFNFAFSVCPNSIDAVSKSFIKHFLFNLSLPLLILLISFVQVIIKQLMPRIKDLTYLMKRYFHNEEDLQKFSFGFTDRLGVAYIRILSLIYKNLSFYALTMIHCISVSNKKVLFIQGNRECYQTWQYIVMVFLGAWVIPFPLVLWQSYRLYIESKKITFFEMLICLTVPICLPLFFLRSYFIFSPPNPWQNSIRDNMVKELFVESYRCKETSNSDHFIFWDHWRLIQRLLLATIATFIINPLERSCYFIPLILLFLIIYLKVLPYKSHLKLLHWCEVVSLVSFCFIIVVSVFDGFFFTYSISEEEPVPTLRRFFAWMDIAVSPLTLLVFYFVILPVGKLIYSKIIP